MKTKFYRSSGERTFETTEARRSFGFTFSQSSYQGVNRPFNSHDFFLIFYFSYLNKDQNSLLINIFSLDQKCILTVESCSKYIRYLLDVLID